MHVCMVITISLWPWWKIIILLWTLDTIHVLSIFWLIVISFCYWCQCLGLFPIRMGIYHTFNLHLVTCGEKKGPRSKRRGKANRWRNSREWNRNGEGGRWRGSLRRPAIFHQGPSWSCQAGVYVSPLDDNVAWHFWNESWVAMAKSIEGRFLQGLK